MSTVSLDFFSLSSIQRSIDKAAAASHAAESAARSAQRSTHDANKRIIDGQKEVINEFVFIREDMLVGFKGVRSELRRCALEIERTNEEIQNSGAETRKAILQLNRSQLITNQNLQALGASLNVLNENVAQGLTLLVNRLDSLQATLEVISESVANPEATKALERYRRARAFIKKGMVPEAHTSIEAAIANDGGQPMLDMPQLMIFRGLLRLGLHDSDHGNFVNIAGARKDFESALNFAEGPELVATIKDKLAVACFYSEDFTTAERLYREIEPHAGMRARFGVAKCLLGQGRTKEAGNLLLTFIERHPEFAVEAASDSFCQSHDKVFIKVGQIIEEQAAKAERSRQLKRQLAEDAERRERVRLKEEARQQAERAEYARRRAQELRDVTKRQIYETINEQLAPLYQHDACASMLRAKIVAREIWERLKARGKACQALSQAMEKDNLGGRVNYSLIVRGLSCTEREYRDEIKVNFGAAYNSHVRKIKVAKIYPLPNGLFEKAQSFGYKTSLGEELKALALAFKFYRDAISIYYENYALFDKAFPKAAWPNVDFPDFPILQDPNPLEQKAGILGRIMQSRKIILEYEEKKSLIAKQRAWAENRRLVHMQAFYSALGAEHFAELKKHSDELQTLHQEAEKWAIHAIQTCKGIITLRPVN